MAREARDGELVVGPEYFMPRLVEPVTQALNWAEYGTENELDIELSFATGRYLHELLFSGVVQEQIENRTERMEDRQLLEGEHPGARVTTLLANGLRVEINVFGGIRDPKAAIDVLQPSAHTKRTEDLEALPRQFNIHVVEDISGIKLAEVWIIEGRGKYPSVTVTDIMLLVNYTDEYRLNHPLSFLLKTQRTKVEALKSRLSSFTESLVGLLPPTQG